MANLAARNSAARLPVPLLLAAPTASSPLTPSADDFGRPVAGPISLCVTNPAAPRPRPGIYPLGAWLAPPRDPPGRNDMVSCYRSSQLGTLKVKVKVNEQWKLLALFRLGQ